MFRQYDLLGGQRDSFRLEERFGLRILDKDFKKLVTVMKSIKNDRKIEEIFDDTVLKKYILKAELGDRVKGAIANNMNPLHYTYRADYKLPTKLKEKYNFKVGLNLGTREENSVVVDDDNINFCIKVSKKKCPTIESMEHCRKSFREESFEFNIHLTNGSLIGKRYPRFYFVKSIDEVANLIQNRNFQVELKTILNKRTFEQYYLTSPTALIKKFMVIKCPLDRYSYTCILKNGQNGLK